MYLQDRTPPHSSHLSSSFQQGRVWPLCRQPQILQLFHHRNSPLGNSDRRPDVCLVDKSQLGKQQRLRCLLDTDVQQGMGLGGSQQLQHQPQLLTEEDSSSRLDKAASVQLLQERCRSRLWS